MTQYQFLKGQLPSFMLAFAPVLARSRYIVDPSGGWDPTVSQVEYEDGIGLLTGQTTIDGVLDAMDAAWEGESRIGSRSSAAGGTSLDLAGSNSTGLTPGASVQRISTCWPPLLADARQSNVESSLSWAFGEDVVR